jgi:hypothetical protein
MPDEPHASPAHHQRVHPQPDIGGALPKKSTTLLDAVSMPDHLAALLQDEALGDPEEAQILLRIPGLP